LKKKIILPEGKNIVAKDASVSPSRPINGVNINVSFSCSSGKTIAAKDFSYSQIDAALNPSEVKECGNATATVSVNGFTPLSKPLTATTTVFELQKEPVPQGSLKAIVKDSETMEALRGIKLTLYKIPRILASTEQSDDAGSFVFTKEPGEYFVKASDDLSHSFDTNNSEVVEIEAGKTKETVILMKKTLPSEVKSLKFKVIDSNDSSPIPRAEIYFSENELLNDTPLTTADDGKARYDNARQSKAYYARVKAAGFVTKFLRAFPSEPNDENYNIVRLEKASTVNSGNIRVFASDEENSAIEGADVQLTNTDFESIPIFDVTNSAGMADFDSESLPAGNYYAFADKREIDANGSEGPKHLNAGAVLDFNVMLVAGIASIKVKVVNDSGSPVSDANVLFYSSSSDVNYSFAKVSGTDGSTEIVGFKVNKHPKIIVSKPGFLPTTIVLYTLHRASAQSPIIVQATLYPVNYANDFMINFAFVSKPNSFEEYPPTQQKIYADKEAEYGMVFDLIVPQNQITQNNVKAHVRTDLDSILNEAAARIVLRQASAERAPIRSANYNRIDAFSDQNIVDNALLDAKQVNLSFGNLSAGTYRFYATVKVKRVPKGTVLELHYTAKSDSKALGDHLKSFKAGESFCKVNCPNFDYLFEIARVLEGQQGEFITANTLPASPADLNYDINYMLRYTVWNSSKNNITQDFDANFSTSDNALVFGNNALNSYSESIIPGIASQLVSGASIENTFLLRGVIKTTTTMRLNLNLGMRDDNAGVAFKISAGNLIISAPEMLIANTAPQDFTIIVAEENTGRPVSGALVQIKASAEALTFESFGAPLYTGSTDMTGQAGFRLVQAFGTNSKLYVSASAPGYNKTLTSIPFSSVFGNNDGFPCVKFEVMSKACSFDANKICLASGDSASGTFKIKTENCAEPVSIKVRGGFTARDGIPVELPLSMPDGNISKIELSENSESRTIQVSKNPKGILGQFPVLAEITGSLTNFKSNKELVVYINFPQFYKDCLAIGKTEFDLAAASVDSNIAENYCFLKHDDPIVPSVSIESELATAALQPKSQQDLGLISLKWRVRADVLEAGTFQATVSEPGSVKFNVNTGVAAGDFEGMTYTPEGLFYAYNSIEKPLTKIRFLSVYPTDISSKDSNKAFIKGTSINLEPKGLPAKTVNVPCTAAGCAWAYSKFETPCPVLNMAHCTLSYFDIPLTGELSNLELSKIAAFIRNPDNNSFLLFEVFGNVSRTITRFDYNNFAVYSGWRDGSIIQEMQLRSDLGALDFGIPFIRQITGNTGKTIVDVNYSIETDNNSVSTWIMGDSSQVKVFAVYNGVGGLYPIIGSGSNEREVMPFSIYNTGLQGEEYSILNVNDYIDEVKKRARSQ
jgi:hypothetical protein